jgi:hypothetical protein
MSFVIPVKLDTPEQEQITYKCYQSIRTFYPEAPVIFVMAKDSLPLKQVYDAEIVYNPGRATTGAARIFADRGTTDHAYILHDSMVVLHKLPEIDPTTEFQAIYHFEGPPAFGDFEHYYNSFFKEKVNQFKLYYTNGVFGPAFLIRKDIADRLFPQSIVDQVNSHLWNQAMERILPVHCVFHSITILPSLCGSIFETDVNPYKHKHRELQGLDELQTLRPYILKFAYGRL